MGETDTGHPPPPPTPPRYYSPTPIPTGTFYHPRFSHLEKPRWQLVKLGDRLQQPHTGKSQKYRDCERSKLVRINSDKIMYIHVLVQFTIFLGPPNCTQATPSTNDSPRIFFIIQLFPHTSWIQKIPLTVKLDKTLKTFSRGTLKDLFKRDLKTLFQGDLKDLFKISRPGPFPNWTVHCPIRARSNITFLSCLELNWIKRSCLIIFCFKRGRHN